ncbi:hypothetical protein VTK56DRAFT_5309 [Thermocarpiscus australiensis]
MAWTPDQVATLLRSRDSAGSDLDEKSWRTSQLKEVLAVVRDLSADGLSAVIEKLADGARDSAWRLPLGDAGFIEFILTVAPTKEAQQPLKKQALRLIGNACADCDENRARVVQSGGLRTFIIHCMKDAVLLPFAIAAALNICVDYRPAQLQASEAGLSKLLVDIVSGERLSSCQSSLSHVMTILELLSDQEPERRIANPNTPALLLGLATSQRYEADLETFIAICTPALAYLTFQDFQPVLLESGGFDALQLAFFQLYNRFDMTDIDPDTAEQLKQVSNTFVTLFADISALPGFSTACSLDSKASQTLIEWLGLSALPDLQTAACLSLGNLSRSDDSSTALLKHVQGSLLGILARAIPTVPSEPIPTLPSEDIPTLPSEGNPTFASEKPIPQTSARPVPPLQLTHAALSFLKNLAIPSANKPLLGAALLDPTQPVLPRLWTSTRTQPQIQFAAVSLARLLLVNCPPNLRHICTPFPDGRNPQSNLSLLTSVAASADEEPIKMEAARAVSLVCRALHLSTTPPDAVPEILDPSWTWGDQSPSSVSPIERAAPESPLPRFYASHADEVTASLSHLLTQNRFPPVRSDTIFVLALMSRSRDGARMALRVLQSNPAAWRALAAAVTGSDELPEAFLEGDQVKTEAEAETKDDGEGEVHAERLMLEPRQVDPQTQKQPAGMARVDRENGMVLIAELLRNFSEELAGLKRPLETMLRKGGGMVVQDGEHESKRAA